MSDFSLKEIEDQLVSVGHFPPKLGDTPVAFGEKMLRLSQIQFELCSMMIECLKKKS